MLKTLKLLTTSARVLNLSSQLLQRRIKGVSYIESVNLQAIGWEDSSGQKIIGDSKSWQDLSSVIPITCSLDMEWHKRGNDFHCDSLTGHSYLNANLSGSVLTAQVMSSTCSTSLRSPSDICNRQDCRVNQTRAYKIGRKLNANKDNDTTTSQAQPTSKKVPNYVFFDAETSGFSPATHEVLQLAALNEGTGESFNVFIRPSKPIRNSAIHGITYENGKMKQDDKEVQCVSPHEAMTKFVQFLSKTKENVLVAHNASFDLRMILSMLEPYPDILNNLVKETVGVVDTLKIFRNKYPKVKKGTEPQPHNLENHKLKTVVVHVLGDDYDFKEHDALGDATALKDIFKTLSLTPEVTLLPWSK